MSDSGQKGDERAGGEAMRPIPDGGLQQSMPEWLRRPPAWRDLPKRESPADAAPAAATTVQDAPAKELPGPDTSEIDPRSLVDVSDLPQWLQDIAARSRETPSSAPVTTEPQDMQPKETEMTEREPRTTTETGRTVEFEPVDKKVLDVPEHETRTYGGGAPKKGTSPVLLGMIALAVIVIIALLLIALL